jgi:hypothetical protein
LFLLEASIIARMAASNKGKKIRPHGGLQQEVSR